MLTTSLRKPRFGFNTHGNVIRLPHNQGRNVTIIAAMDDQNGIGIDNRIPWDVPPDMAQFKRLTTGHAVVMGRKTWESLGCKPLPNRSNFVITRDVEKAYEITKNNRAVVTGCTSLEQALVMCGNRQIFIIGGGEIYRQALDCDMVDDMILTRFEKQAFCDTHFPSVFPTMWQGPAFSSHEHVRLRFRYEYYWRNKKE